jgi:hypothetical protein
MNGGHHKVLHFAEISIATFVSKFARNLPLKNLLYLPLKLVPLFFQYAAPNAGDVQKASKGS